VSPAPLTVTGAYVAVENGMGQQLADSQLLAALGARPDLDVRPLAVGSVRSTLRPDRRLPLGLLDRSPRSLKRAIGAVTYPRGLVHRFDCRLPPAPHEVVTVHDLAPLRFADEGGMPQHVGPALRRALAVVCPSEFSAGELRTEYGVEHVRVVPNGLDEVFVDARPLPVPERERMQLPERYVLHTGGATARKNLAALAGAWPAVRAAAPNVGLVLCGPVDERRSGLFHDLPGTHLLGKVPRHVLVGLMAAAAVVVVPSRYEGYGLPALEAMACGVPVVAARCASLPEVLAGHGNLVEPDGDGLAEGLIQALAVIDADQLSAARETARARTWASSARQYEQVYREVLDRAEAA